MYILSWRARLDMAEELQLVREDALRDLPVRGRHGIVLVKEDTVNRYMGADETAASTIPFIRFLNPTDVQDVVQALRDKIATYHGGLDVLNPFLWMEVGLNNAEGPVYDFVQRLIEWERVNQATVTAKNGEVFLDHMTRSYEYNLKHLADYVKAFTSLVAESRVPSTIAQPWGYTPTSAAEDVGAAVATATTKMAPLLLGALAVYAAVTVLIPKLILRKA